MVVASELPSLSAPSTLGVDPHARYGSPSCRRARGLAGISRTAARRLAHRRPRHLRGAGSPDAQRRAISLGGLIKHVANTERHWIVGTMMQQPLPDRSGNWGDDFRLLDGETLAGALALYDEVAQETERIVAGIEDLGRAVPV